MNEPLMREWIAELRSGKWTKIKRVLTNDDNGRCAMGVLAETSAGGMRSHHIRQRAVGAYLALGFNLSSPLLETSLWHRIVRMNNDTDATFEQIANWLEEQLTTAPPVVEPAQTEMEMAV